jgi:hypothetical protein
MRKKWTLFDEKFREFLKDYFLKTLNISTGFIIDSNDNISKQMDIISDAAFFLSGQRKSREKTGQ